MDGVRSTPALGRRQLTLGIGVCGNRTRLEGIGNDVGPTVTTGGRCGNPAASGNIRDVAADVQGVGLSRPGLEEKVGDIESGDTLVRFQVEVILNNCTSSRAVLDTKVAAAHVNGLAPCIGQQKEQTVRDPMVQTCFKSVVARVSDALFIVYVCTYPGHWPESVDGVSRRSCRKCLGRRIWFAFIVEPPVVAARIRDGEKRLRSDFPLDLDMPLV